MRQFRGVAGSPVRSPVLALSGTGGASLIGGVAVGAPGAAGTIYEGYTLSWGDDFESLNILGPANPSGRWWTTRTYLAGSRGSDTLLGTMYDTDPLMTGYNDSNRGVPVGYSNMSAASSVLALQARKATAGEQVHMQSTRNEVAAMIAGPGVVHWYPGAANTEDIIYEGRIKFTAAAGNPAGWHPTMWLQSLNPTIAINSDELDWEGNKSNAYFNQNIWTSGSATSNTAGSPYAHDGNYHTVAFIINTTSVKLYIDGTLYATGAWNGNTKSKPQYPLVTCHVYSGTYNGDTYSAAAWNADGDGATLSVDWLRVWRRTGKSHFTPRVGVSSVNVDYGSSTVITLPSAATIWGDGSVTEYLQAVYNEENEPGVDHTTIYTQFPTGVSYNSGTRELTVNITSGKTGRINFVLSAWKADGSTGEPLRFAVNVGPRLSVSGFNFTTGAVVSYDVYAVCDCGVLTTNGTSKAKTISVSGLSGSGLSYDDSTGLLTGTAVAGSYSIGVTITNSVGQSKTTNVTMTISAASYAYESWTGKGWFDASDAANITVNGSNQVTAATNKRSGQGDLTGGGTIANRTYVSAAQNGRNAIRIVRDVTAGGTALPRLVASSAAAISTMFQGNDKPYTTIVAYKPTDTNTGFIWSASDTVDSTDSQRIGLVRRNATACSVRRQLVEATSNDVSWGSGQASGTPRVVAIKHTGTTVTVWDNSATTKAVNGTAQDVNTFNTQLAFMLFGSEGPGASDPYFAEVQGNMDFYEIVVEDSAKADADIEQAITDIASKWGITLS
jgi:hypothetical protein